MALKIRLRQQGRNNRPFYRVVVADVRSPRDGKYVEALGWYNPFEAEADKNLFLNADRIQHWLSQGAEITESVEALIGRSAPAVMKAQTQKKVERKEKARVKRNERKAAAKK